MIDQEKTHQILKAAEHPDKKVVEAVLLKAEAKKGLTPSEAAILLNTHDPDLVRKLFDSAAKIKDEIYGERLVFFAPLYLSNYCVNNCSYCGFHAGNSAVERKNLSLDEVEVQAKAIINMGHKRVLLECGEDKTKNPIDYVVSAMGRIYEARGKSGSNIRRINVNIAATEVDDYRKLKAAGIGTYQLFQETYHRPTYEKLHKGPKADYDRQISAHEKALEAGIDDLGIGVLFGLYDFKFEVVALITHAQYMEKKLGVGPHTISVPRCRPADGVEYKPEHHVSDDDFLMIIAVLRLAVPYTGMILSTRERADLRTKAFKLGISQASAASRTSPGGYGEGIGRGQFSVNDERPLDEVIKSVLDQELLPSFCTACYRRGRTGEAFMELAKPGEIHNFCRPNGILTFKEYVEDFASDDVKRVGLELITKYLSEIVDEKLRKGTEERLQRIEKGERDIYF